MLLSDEHVRQFQEMYFDHFKKDISKEAAYESAVKLIELVEIAYQPLTEEDLVNVEKSRREIRKRFNKEETNNG